MRRRHLLAAAGGVGIVGFAGCIGSFRTRRTDTSGSDPTTTVVSELAAPSDRVGSEAYRTTLEARIESDSFPDPDPELMPTLTEARFVADAATEV